MLQERMMITCMLVVSFRVNMMAQWSEDAVKPAARWGARIAVLALRSQTRLAPSSHEVIYSLAASNDSLRIDQVVETLATMPKPLSCKALLRGSRVVLDCNTLVDKQFVEHVRSAGERAARDWAMVVREVCGADPDPKVLVASAQDAAIIPFSGVQQFMRDYHMAHSLGWQAIEPKLLPEGVCGLFAVGPPHEVHVNLRHPSSRVGRSLH